jgi:hypothetical protein
MAGAPTTVASGIASLGPEANKAGPIILAMGVSADKSKYQLPLFKNLLPSSRAALLVGFNPVACLARTLRAHLTNNALVCVDGLAGTTVGIVWKPAAFRLEGKDEKERARELYAALLPVTTVLAQAGAGMLKGVELQA